MNREGIDWIRMDEVREDSVTLALNVLEGTAAPDGASITARVADHEAKEILGLIDGRSSMLPSGVEIGQLVISEIPGSRVSFQFIWNGMPADSVFLDWNDAKGLLEDAIAAMKARKRAKAFA